MYGLTAQLIVGMMMQITRDVEIIARLLLIHHLLDHRPVFERQLVATSLVPELNHNQRPWGAAVRRHVARLTSTDTTINHEKEAPAFALNGRTPNRLSGLFFI